MRDSLSPSLLLVSDSPTESDRDRLGLRGADGDIIRRVTRGLDVGVSGSFS